MGSFFHFVSCETDPDDILKAHTAWETLKTSSFLVVDSRSFTVSQIDGSQVDGFDLPKLLRENFDTRKYHVG